MERGISHPWVWALAACVVAAALEAILSGTQVKARFAELRLPRPTIPLWAWAIVGFAYYALFFLVLTSLLGSRPTPVWTPVALVLSALLLVSNAAWNGVFFRKKDLRLSCLLFLPYLPAALALAAVLLRLRNPLFPWFALYVLYLAYAAWWGARVWRLNTQRSARCP